MSLKPSGQVRCLIRKEEVVATPEEMVRQQLIHQMVSQLEYPLNSLVLERALNQMPHLALQLQGIPSRRADLICFAKGIHSEYDLYPLLLIECKSVKLSSKVISQVTGYNHFLKAYYICVANQAEIRTGWYDNQKQDYNFVNHLPSYRELLQPFQK